MKGAVVEFKEHRGFGFIRDENGDKVFFHINDMKEKSEFLTNLTDYYFSEVLERRCYAVDFTLGNNKTGPAAKNIILTDEIVNDKTITGDFMAKITNVKRKEDTWGRISQGYKKGQSPPPFATAGGNGTYRLGYPEKYKYVFVDFIRTDTIGWGHIDVRDLALSVNSRSNITDKFVDDLKNKLVGNSIRIVAIKNEWALKDKSILKL